jgi:hypothetical protein
VRRRLLAAALGSLVAALPGAGRAGHDAPPAAVDGRALLAAALDARYECDVVSRLRLTLHGRGGGVRVRELHTASKRRGGRLHALGRVLLPESLRGVAVLSVEAPGRPDDVFVFLPSLGRTRRIASARRGEPFLGSDLAWEDFERHRVEDYRVVGLEREDVGDEAALRVLTVPRAGDGWTRADFVVAEADRAILAVAHHRGAGGPGRVVRFPRAHLRRYGANLIPLRIEAESPRRGTRTVVEVLEIAVGVELDDALFSSVALESGRRLPAPAAGHERAPLD